MVTLAYAKSDVDVSKLRVTEKKELLWNFDVADEEKWSDLCCEAGNPVPGYVCELLESPDFKKAPANFE